MNIYQKLQKMRVELQSMNIKKSGENRFAGYKYYELGDFLPPINKLMSDNGVCSVVTYGDVTAELTLYNAEKPDEAIVFTSPMKEAVLKGAHPIQNLGAVETYQRRYLYMTAFEIVEADALDATQGKETQQPTQNTRGGQKPAQQPPRGSQRAQPQSQAKQPQSQAKQPQPQQGSPLPKELVDQLNAAIVAAKEAVGETIAVVTRKAEDFSGIKIADVCADNARYFIDALNEIAEGKELPF